MNVKVWTLHVTILWRQRLPFNVWTLQSQSTQHISWPELYCSVHITPDKSCTKAGFQLQPRSLWHHITKKFWWGKFSASQAFWHYTKLSPNLFSCVFTNWEKLNFRAVLWHMKKINQQNFQSLKFCRLHSWHMGWLARINPWWNFLVIYLKVTIFTGTTVSGFAN